MKIVNIVPGFGGTFYCGNCLRDSGYTKSLIKLGHDAMMLPIYLPLTMKHGVDKSESPLFYGSVNVYLKQNFPFLRCMPQWMENFLNSPAILSYAAKKAGSTRTEGLEEMTISMILGKDGNQKKELQELIDFLKNHEKPDVVHLSNSLLLGLAEEIKKQLKIPVVCSLQDEDVWVDAMNDYYSEKVWKLMSIKAKDVDAFIAVSDYFANEMKQKMDILDEKLYVSPIGIDPEIYPYSEPKLAPPVIGFISRMYEPHGFGLLIDAFIELKKDGRFSNTLLKLSGGYTADDKKYVKKQLRKIRKAGLIDDVEIVEDYEPENRYKFFNQLTLLSVPVIKGEAFGTYMLESLASGIPLVQPALGAFPEVIAKTNGGITYSPNTPAELAKAWAKLLPDKEKIMQLSKQGSDTVRKNFNIFDVSKDVLEIYKNLVDAD